MNKEAREKVIADYLFNWTPSGHADESERNALRGIYDAGYAAAQIETATAEAVRYDAAEGKPSRRKIVDANGVPICDVWAFAGGYEPTKQLQPTEANFRNVANEVVTALNEYPRLKDELAKYEAMADEIRAYLDREALGYQGCKCGECEIAKFVRAAIKKGSE